MIKSAMGGSIILIDWANKQVMRGGRGGGMGRTPAIKGLYIKRGTREDNAFVTIKLYVHEQCDLFAIKYEMVDKHNSSP